MADTCQAIGSPLAMGRSGLDELQESLTGLDLGAGLYLQPRLRTECRELVVRALPATHERQQPQVHLGDEQLFLDAHRPVTFLGHEDLDDEDAAVRAGRLGAAL